MLLHWVEQRVIVGRGAGLEREGRRRAGEIPQDCCGTGNKMYSSEAVGKSVCFG